MLNVYKIRYSGTKVTHVKNISGVVVESIRSSTDGTKCVLAETNTEACSFLQGLIAADDFTVYSCEQIAADVEIAREPAKMISLSTSDVATPEPAKTSYAPPDISSPRDN